MKAPSNQTLFHIEDLTLPSFQVIVMRANLECDQCRKRVSHLLSNLTGMREYTVDVSNKQVILKGDLQWNMKSRNKKQMNNRQCPSSFKFFLAYCFGR